jgi:lipopolysaccharide transport system ATP-binding protein
MMPDWAVRAEGLGKRYRFGRPRDVSLLQEGTIETRSAPFRKKSWWQRVSDIASPIVEKAPEFWALKDLSFEIKRGEVVGIIGRNGAGKSTLLKILSRITKPTEGTAELQGRVSSLLEVGTGFHPELTGRENILLSGALLGLRKGEIKKKFDDIVSFAGVHQFIDTPVKHFSSGMYVRLAFAVAAHLEPDILIIDEVLAVGDIEFQKKCLGTMEEAAKKTGRTILFVSHNMGAILSLCEKALLIDQGRLVEFSSVKQTVNSYLEIMNPDKDHKSGVFVRAPFDVDRDLLVKAELCRQDQSTGASFEYGESLGIRVHTNARLTEKFGMELRIKNSQHQVVAYVSGWIDKGGHDGLYRPGEQVFIRVPNLPFLQDTYYIDFICRVPGVYHIDNWWDSVHFEITACRPGHSPISLQALDQLGSIVLPASFSRVPQC